MVLILIVLAACVCIFQCVCVCKCPDSGCLAVWGAGAAIYWMFYWSLDVNTFKRLRPPPLKFRLKSKKSPNQIWGSVDIWALKRDLTTHRLSRICSQCWWQLGLETRRLYPEIRWTGRSRGDMGHSCRRPKHTRSKRHENWDAKRSSILSPLTRLSLLPPKLLTTANRYSPHCHNLPWPLFWLRWKFGDALFAL